jgi:hypothetical protein
MKAEILIGVWELISCEGRSSDGQSFLPYGPHPIGKLIYTEDGHLTVTLMNADRTLFASNDISQSSADEVAAAFGSFDCYSGRWRLNEGTSTIEHFIEAGRIPNWVGTTHLRYCSIEDGELILSTDHFLMAGNTWRVYVKWRRPHDKLAKGGC